MRDNLPTAHQLPGLLILPVLEEHRGGRMEEKDLNGAAPDEKWKMAVEGRGNCINRNVGTNVENHVQGKSGVTVG